jgi:hypothetical protein
MPFYRQAQALRRLGIVIDRGTRHQRCLARSADKPDEAGPVIERPADVYCFMPGRGRSGSKSCSETSPALSNATAMARTIISRRPIARARWHARLLLGARQAWLLRRNQEQKCAGRPRGPATDRQPVRNRERNPWLQRRAQAGRAPGKIHADHRGHAAMAQGDAAQAAAGIKDGRGHWLYAQPLARPGPLP